MYPTISNRSDSFLWLSCKKLFTLNCIHRFGKSCYWKEDNSLNLLLYFNKHSLAAFSINLKELIITYKYIIFIILSLSTNHLPKTYTILQSQLFVFFMPSFPFPFYLCKDKWNYLSLFFTIRKQWTNFWNIYTTTWSTIMFLNSCVLFQQIQKMNKSMNKNAFCLGGIYLGRQSI